MSIDKIKEDNQISYVFDIQSTFDQDATDSYVLTKKRKEYQLQRIKDYQILIVRLKTYKAKRIKNNTKDCEKFGKVLEKCIKEYQYNYLLGEEETFDISQEEIQNIASHYKKLLLEVKNKGSKS